MGQVVVTIAGRTYRMNCDDGQEGHLERLARDVDARMGGLRGSFGEIGDQRLVVMTALSVADELDTAQRRIAELEGALDDASMRVTRLVEVLNDAKD